MFKKTYLVRLSKLRKIHLYEEKFEEITGFLKSQYFTDKVSQETYEYIYNLLFDMLDLIYEIGEIYDDEKKDVQIEG